MTSPVVLDVSGLTVGYERPDRSINTVVFDVSLTLQAGTVLGLAGESGCGKSTLALASMGYRAPRCRILGGESRLLDRNLLALEQSQLRSYWGRQIAYVHQNAATSLNPALPIGRQLSQPLARHMKLRGEQSRRRQLELLDEMGIENPEIALTKYPHQLSGGQQQRIALALALCCQPDVLILDEPTTGLDVTTQARITALFRELVQTHQVAALYVSHDLSLLSTIAERLAVMYAGEVVEAGPAVEVCSTPRHPYTQALLQAVPSTHERRVLTGIPGGPPTSVVEHVCAFSPRCRHVTDECLRGPIPLTPIGDNRQVRCVRAAVIVPSPLQDAPPPPTPQVTKPLLTVSDIYCAHRVGAGHVVAVRGVSFSVAGGETIGVVGESGSGKSTLLRAIAGLHQPFGGSIQLREESLAAGAAQRPRHVRREIQLVFQNPDSSLNPRHRVAEIVARPIRMFREDISRSQENEAVEALLESVKLPRSLVSRHPYELSGGQKQRVAVARAFAARPSILLCDEVTSALDVSVQATIIELISELASEFGAAIVFVSHDLAVVRSIAGRALVMQRGIVCEEGPIEELFSSPQHPYTAELLSSIPDLAAASA